MDKHKPCCKEKSSEPACSACDSCMPMLYWCETCQRQVAEKRCPGCGLKTRKIRLEEMTSRQSGIVGKLP